MECMSIGFVCIYAVLAVHWFIALNFLTFQKDAESVASEMLKRRIPGRHCNGIDIVGNLIGVGAGSVGAVLTVIAIIWQLQVPKLMIQMS